MKNQEKSEIRERGYFVLNNEKFLKGSSGMITLKRYESIANAKQAMKKKIPIIFKSPVRTITEQPISITQDSNVPYFFDVVFKNHQPIILSADRSSHWHVRVNHDLFTTIA